MFSWFEFAVLIAAIVYIARKIYIETGLNISIRLYIKERIERLNTFSSALIGICRTDKPL